MNEHRPIYKKGSLLYATIVALACVMTAGVSTFAWFQAEANVRVSASNSSANITVSKGLDYSLYAFKGNYTGNDPIDGLAYGYVTSSLSNGFNDDFYLIDSTAKATKAISAINNLWPGRKLTYCLEVTGIRLSNVRLTLTRFTSGIADTSGGRLARKTYGVAGNPYIEIGWAINIYADSATSPDDYARHISGKALSDGTTALEDHFSYAPGTAIAKDEGKTYTSSTNVLINTTQISSSKTYLFYTVEFSDSSDTWYQEVSSSGEALKESASSGTRWFEKNSTIGSSSCYEGLNFSVDALKVTEAGS